MAIEMNMDGKVIFDDQISERIDGLLAVRGVAMVYRMEKTVSWMKVIGDCDLKHGLRKLSDRQRRFIESVVFEQENQYEVMVRYHMTDEEMFDAMTELRNVLAETA